MTDSMIFFFNILFDVSLFQINGIFNDYSKILDLIFMNEKEDWFIKRCDPISPPEDRFHPTIELNIYVLAEVRKKHRYKVISCHRLDYNKFNYLLLNVDWDSVILRNNLDNIIFNFYAVLRHCISESRFASQARHQNEIRKIFLRRFPLSRLLAKTLRVNKIAMKSFSKKKSVVRSRL